MKKLFKLTPILLAISLLLVGCGSEKGSGPNGSDREIVVVSREEGSGTRSAFVELTDILEESGDEKIDRTTDEAVTQMQTETVIQTVSGNENAIGYISTGSVSDVIKTVKVNGVEPSIENIKDGSYKISRPFILVNRKTNDLVDDFIHFVLSKEGQEIVSDSYIDIESDYSYEASDLEGKIVVAGSTSVSPVMEKLAEEYMSLNDKTTIEIQQTGSSAGIMSTIEGTADLGMSSRNLETGEEKEVNKHTIALDGIAVITHKENKVDSLTIEEIRNIFIGEITNWKDLDN